MIKENFFSKVRAAFGELKQSQVDGFNAILDGWEASGLTDPRWLAYMLATVWHETARTMQPIKEYGLGKGRQYGKPDARTGQTYYGRGFVQLTWYGNYLKLGDLLGVDLVHKPDLALDLNIATQILFQGMTKGIFTGRKLDQYFNDTVENPVGARKIINRLDKAELIAGYYKNFLV